MDEMAVRRELADAGGLLYRMGYAVGTGGNLSARCGDVVLMTPTGVSLGELKPERLSRLTMDGRLLEGEPPTKEASMHLGCYRARPDCRAVAHLHSTHATAVACLADLADEPIPPLTPYYLLRVGRLGYVPCFLPGSKELAQAVEQAAAKHRSILLANHGPVVMGQSIREALHTSQELEQAAQMFLLLRGMKTSPIPPDQLAQLRAKL